MAKPPVASGAVIQGLCVQSAYALLDAIDAGVGHLLHQASHLAGTVDFFNLQRSGRPSSGQGELFQYGGAHFQDLFK